MHLTSCLLHLCGADKTAVLYQPVDLKSVVSRTRLYAFKLLQQRMQVYTAGVYICSVTGANVEIQPGTAEVLFGM